MVQGIRTGKERATQHLNLELNFSNTLFDNTSLHIQFSVRNCYLLFSIHYSLFIVHYVLSIKVPTGFLA